jgi:cobalt-zinc-cadmium efflux system protein
MSPDPHTSPDPYTSADHGAASGATGGRGEHGHDHGHDHGHAHGPAPKGSSARRALTLALVITLGMAAIEAVGSYLSGSLALLSDAGHMATDAAALGLALFAQWVARRPASPTASYGYARAEVLAAFVNAIALLALVAYIAIEAVRRLLAPEPVAGGTLLVVAVAGLVANLASAWILSRATGSLNARGAMLHVLSDILGSIAAIVAGIVILTTGWMPIDPILSLVVSLLIVRSTWRLLAQSTGILMEGVPAHLDYDDIGRALLQIPGVSEVHDLHVWYMSAEHAALSAHVAIDDGAQWPRILDEARRMLVARCRIDHVTLQPSWPVRPDFGDRRVIPIAAKGDG